MAEKQPTPALSRAADVALLGLPAAVLLAAALVSRGATRIYTWPWALWVQLALLAMWLWTAQRFACGRRGLRAGWWIALPLLTALAVSVLTSAHPHEALEASLVLATPLLILPHTAELWLNASAERRLVFLRVLTVALSGLSILSLTSWFAEAPADGVFSWFFSARNPHTLGHWNYTGGLALLTLPFTVLLAVRDRGLARLAWAAALLLSLVQFLSAGSRGAVLALVAALAVSGATLITRRRFSGRAVLAGLLMLLMIGAGAIATNPRLRQGIRDPGSLFAIGGSEQQRLGFILTGIEIARAHPWTGIGPGTTPYHYPEHRVDRAGALENSFQLHCGPLQWIVDTGLLGLGALMTAGAIALTLLWRSRRHLEPDAIAALAVIAGYGTLWLTDYQLDVPLIPVVLAAALAILLSAHRPSASDISHPHASSHAVGAIALVLLVLAMGTALVPAWRARASFAAAWKAGDADQPALFVKHLRSATEFAPWHPYYWNHLGRALAGAAEQMPPESATALRAEARSSWQASLRASPSQDYPWLNLGWLALAAGDASEALRCLERAAAIYPRRTGLWYATGLAHINRSDLTAAARAMAREIAQSPEFITAPFWADQAQLGLRTEVLMNLGTPSDRTDSTLVDSRSTALEAFARWWWLGEVDPESHAQSTDPAGVFLSSFREINNRSVDTSRTALPTPLAELREVWQTGGIPDPRGPGMDSDHTWLTLVRNDPASGFTRLIRSFPGSAARTITRNADGVLYRQLDGDRLSDLTRLPCSPLTPRLAPVLPYRRTPDESAEVD